ncbi:hypothetical protein [Merdimonas faecis]|uniref:hypothetical protein n=1 Tax=Merdimonas faecis TaxID=1653435 RepID=UPI0022DF018B|nr:hypothetical protein [Merdimonas faecis]
MLGVTPGMAFFFILFSNCQSFVGQTKNLMGFVNSSKVSRGRFGTSWPEAVGSVPTPEHAAGMGQENFSGRTAKSENGGTHDRKSI